MQYTITYKGNLSHTQFFASTLKEAAEKIKKQADNDRDLDFFEIQNNLTGETFKYDAIRHYID